MVKSTNQSSGKAIFFVIIIIIAFIGYCNRNKESSNTQPLLTSKEMEWDAVMFSQEFVKDKLKSPETAEFADYYSNKEAYNYLINPSDSTFTVSSWVKAKNPFGVTLKNKYRVEMKYTGGDKNDGRNWTLLDLDLYDED